MPSPQLFSPHAAVDPSVTSSPTLAPSGGSLVDSTYAASSTAPMAGTVTEVNRYDPEGTASRPNVAFTVLASEARGEAVISALLASGLPPLEIGRDLRYALDQGRELIRRILEIDRSRVNGRGGPLPFNQRLLEPLASVWAFDTLGGELRDRAFQGSDQDFVENAVAHVFGKLEQQFPSSVNEQMIREVDHAARIAGNHDGTQVEGVRGSDLFLVDASFTGHAVLDGANVTRVINKIHFDGPARWVGPWATSHRYTFLMKKVDEAGRVVAEIRSSHNHQLEGPGLVGTDHLTLFEPPQTGLHFSEIFGVLIPIFALIPGGQLAAAGLSFANAGFRLVESGWKNGLLEFGLAGLNVVGAGIGGAVGSQINLATTVARGGEAALRGDLPGVLTSAVGTLGQTQVIQPALAGGLNTAINTATTLTSGPLTVAGAFGVVSEVGSHFIPQPTPPAPAGTSAGSTTFDPGAYTFIDDPDATFGLQPVTGPSPTALGLTAPTPLSPPWLDTIEEKLAGVPKDIFGGGVGEGPLFGGSGGELQLIASVPANGALGQKQKLMLEIKPVIERVSDELNVEFSALGLELHPDRLLATLMQEADAVAPRTAISFDGGLGYMQLTPYDGKLDAEVAQELGWNNQQDVATNQRNSNWRSPYANLRAGAVVMLLKARALEAALPATWKKMTEEQRWRAVMFAYNAGEGTAIDALERGGPNAEMVSRFRDSSGALVENDYVGELQEGLDYVRQNQPAWNRNPISKSTGDLIRNLPRR